MRHAEPSGLFNPSWYCSLYSTGRNNKDTWTSPPAVRPEKSYIAAKNMSLTLESRYFHSRPRVFKSRTPGASENLSPKQRILYLPDSVWKYLQICREFELWMYSLCATRMHKTVSKQVLVRNLYTKSASLCHSYR